MKLTLKDIRKVLILGSGTMGLRMKTYIDAGKLGQKTGQGFYIYPNPAFMKPDFVNKG